MKSLIAVTLTVCAFSSPANAVFKCEVDGKITFSQTRCAPTAETIQIKTHTPSAESAEHAASRADAIKAQLDKNQTQRETRRIRAKIRTLETDVERYQKLQDMEIDVLQKKKSRANNNLAGATWEQSISQEMQAVVQNYSTKINTARDQIKRLQKRLDEMQASN